jgi:hypothetical protein
MGALVVSYNFMLEYSYRADPLVKKGEERGKIIMIREVRKEGRRRNSIPLQKFFPV